MGERRSLFRSDHLGEFVARGCDPEVAGVGFDTEVVVAST